MTDVVFSVHTRPIRAPRRWTTSTPPDDEGSADRVLDPTDHVALALHAWLRSVERGVPDRVSDTSNCPLGGRCESCGAERDDLTVYVVRAGRLGMMCLSLCVRCARAAPDGPFPVSASTAERLVAQHVQHLDGGHG